ncbi:hypothetical protein BJ982_003035 [Sphaerisporangium siamense]|uniref:Uncharacterized protein n=1 Tax=Sphaerisporangium siamense TaxID=795645 RepID=A0A7W7D7L3_9ACTN|nr:hypothetical protein [Sphaerisporangium siamense]MBB4701491.1 hypothetical protein [Sphaerisporangium siamense]
MDSLAKLARSVAEFADTASLTLVPAVPGHALGAEVCLAPDVLDLPGFLALARKLGGGVLYLKAAPFDPGDDEYEVDDPPEHLLKRKGQIGQLSVAFATNGIVHFWKHRAGWYAEWQQLAEDEESPDDAEDEDGRLTEEERERLTTELVEALLANPEFRAAKAGARHRTGSLAIPPDTPRGVEWEALRIAYDRAEELAKAAYAQIGDDRLDELAAELLATPEYQRASAPATRKQITERFLTRHADGFSPPAPIRDELYARAQKFAKAGKTQGLF